MTMTWWKDRNVQNWKGKGKNKVIGRAKAPPLINDVHKWSKEKKRTACRERGNSGGKKGDFECIL